VTLARCPVTFRIARGGRRFTRGDAERHVDSSSPEFGHWPKRLRPRRRSLAVECRQLMNLAVETAAKRPDAPANIVAEMLGAMN